MLSKAAGPLGYTKCITKVWSQQVAKLRFGVLLLLIFIILLAKDFIPWQLNYDNSYMYYNISSTNKLYLLVSKNSDTELCIVTWISPSSTHFLNYSFTYGHLYWWSHTQKHKVGCGFTRLMEVCFSMIDTLLLDGVRVAFPIEETSRTL